MKKHYLILLVVASVTLISGTVDLGNLFNYANQSTPTFAAFRDNSPLTNRISDKGATLGRVLFYDKALSLNDEISCASCHKQELAFGDNEALSLRFDGGRTARHSIRLVNYKHSQEGKGFWDERAANLEDLALMPIQSNEMGFEGTNADNTLDALVEKLSKTNRYRPLFQMAYGDENITQDRIAKSLAQFIRSIQSFDSRYDIGRSQAFNLDLLPFPNFTAAENLGKSLFFGRARCQTCHRAPLFDIDPNSRNNGVIADPNNPSGVDITVTKSPSLRDLFNPKGGMNGPMMHDGSFNEMSQVIAHYNSVPLDARNNNLDPRLRGFSLFNLFGGGTVGQTLNLRANEQQALGAFLGTLTGSAIYTDERWSNPFNEDGSLTILGVDGQQIGQEVVEIEEIVEVEQEVVEVEQGIVEVEQEAVEVDVCATIGDTDGDGICNDLDECPEDPGNNCIEATLCNKINIGSDGISDMVIETPEVFFKTIQVRRGFRVLFSCFNNCGETTVIPNLGSGDYQVIIRLYDNTFSVLCEVDQITRMDSGIITETSTNVSSRIASNSAINTTVNAVDKDTYQVYPNPAQHELFVDLTTYAGQKANLQLINQLGQTLQSLDFDELPSDKIRLDINKAENGLHFLNIILDDKEMITERVMVSKF